MEEFWKTLLIACIPAIVTAVITGFTSYWVACKNAKNELKKMEKEFEQQLALLDKKSGNSVAEQMMAMLTTTLLQNPEMQAKLSQAIRNSDIGKK